MPQRYFIPATTLAAQGFCAAAGGATFTPPPRSNSKSISYKRFAQHSDGTLRSRKDCGVPLLCVLILGKEFVRLTKSSGSLLEQFVKLTKSSENLLWHFVRLTKPSGNLLEQFVKFTK
jgi:hypothetical protein